MEINTFLQHKEEDTPNVMLVKELYKALNGGDKITLSKILSNNPVWNVCPGCPEGGTYIGMNEVFGSFYRKLVMNLDKFAGEPEVFIDGGNVVVALGFYSFSVRAGEPSRRVRFSHTWKISSDSCIEGVWQVCDSFEMRGYINNK